MLIQTQYMRCEILEQMSAMDALLRQNYMTASMSALLPAAVGTTIVVTALRRIVSRLRSRRRSRARCRPSMLGRAAPQMSWSAKHKGKAFTLVYSCFELRSLPHSPLSRSDETARDIALVLRLARRRAVSLGAGLPPPERAALVTLGTGAGGGRSSCVRRAPMHMDGATHA